MQHLSKLIPVDKLRKVLEEKKAENKKIIISHGMFDSLHVGHFRHLKQSKDYGDILVVNIFPDRFNGNQITEGSNDEKKRAEALSLLEWVDFVVIDNEKSLGTTLKKLQPDIFVCGRENFQDFRPDFNQNYLNALLNELKIKFKSTNEQFQTPVDSLNSSGFRFSKETMGYLNIFKSRYTIESIIELIEKMHSLNVLIVGDTILDEYSYCHTLGVSSKSPTLAVKYDYHELFAGGILAIANHASNFCQSVKLVTLTGSEDEYRKFIKDRLNPNIEPKILTQENVPTLIKRRIVEPHSLNKLLEIYIMDDSGIDNQTEIELCRCLTQLLSDYDLVIAGDFGHGAITDKVRLILESDAGFLAVNTQANAGNKLVHTISRYSRADYVSIAENELRLETRDLHSDFRPMLQNLRQKLKSKAFVVTRGKKGSCISYGKEGSYFNVPAFTQSVLDSVGAGDAFFAISTMAAYLNAPPEIIVFLGNVVGALAVEIIGNKRSVQKEEVINYIYRLLR